MIEPTSTMTTGVLRETSDWNDEALAMAVVPRDERYR